MKPATMLLKQGKKEKLWNDYCGFLDLNPAEFMEIQENLLLEQITRIQSSELGRQILGDARPESVEDFRNQVPFTIYQDYTDFLLDKSEDGLPGRPSTWVRTSGRSGAYAHKWIPYTQEMVDIGAKAGLACFMISSARDRGDVNLEVNDVSLYTLAPPPYISGLLLEGTMQEFDFDIRPSPEEAREMDFQERIQDGFRIALSTGLDYFYGITSILLKVSENFSNPASGKDRKLSDLGGLVAIVRLLKAAVISKLQGRPMLPRDIWKVKGVLCGGTDTSIFKETVAYSWGVTPLEVYASAEFGIIATQVWNHHGMTFFPYLNYWEFLSPDDYYQLMEDRTLIPETKTLDQLELGKNYVIVGTSFHGGSLIRFINGDMIRIIDMVDAETGIKTPQMVFNARIDGIIDLGGFTRLTEKTIWKAIENIDIPYVDFTVNKEYEGDQLTLNIYIEFSEDGRDPGLLADMVHEQLVLLDSDYKDMDLMGGLKPVKITPLTEGTFKRYFQDRQASGADLAHLKPTHVAPSKEVLSRLIEMSELG